MGLIVGLLSWYPSHSLNAVPMKLRAELSTDLSRLEPWETTSVQMQSCETHQEFLDSFQEETNHSSQLFFG